MAGYNGLDKQSLDIRLGGGMDEAKHEYTADAPSLLLAQNVRFDDEGAIQKRHGSALEAQTDRPSTYQSNSVHELGGALVQWNPEGLYLQNELRTEWDRTNECGPRPSRVLTDPLFRGPQVMRKPDIAVSGDLACVIWEVGTVRTGGASGDVEIYYAFFDVTTRALIAGPKSFGTSAAVRRNARVITIDSGARFAIVGLSGFTGTGTVGFSTYQISVGSYAFAAPSSLALATATDEVDVCTDGGANFHVMWHPSSTTTRVTQCTNAGATGTSNTVSATFVGRAICLNGGVSEIQMADLTGQVAYFSTAYGAVTKATLFTPTTNIAFTRATISQKDSGGAALIAISATGQSITTGASNGVGTDLVVMSSSHALTKQGHLYTVVIAAKAFYSSASGLADALLPLCNQVGINQAATGAAAGIGYLPLPVGYLCRYQVDANSNASVAVVGRFLQDKIDKTGDDEHLSSQFFHGTEHHFAATVLVDASPAFATELRRTQIDLVRAWILNAPAQRSVTAKGLRLMGSGAGVSCFDGQQFAENTPDIIGAVAALGLTVDAELDAGTVASPGNIDGASVYHRLRLVARWVDAKGNIHRGPPGPEKIIDTEANMALAGTQHNPTPLVFPAPFPTALNGDRGTYMEVEVYEAVHPDGETWHLVGVCKPVAFATTALYKIRATWSYAVNDLPSDAFNLQGLNCEGLPQAYFDDEIENTPCPPLLDICSTQGRLWGLSAEARDVVVATKPLSPGNAPEFCTDLAVLIPAEGGDGVAVAALDDKVLVLKESAVYIITGEPGDASGAGNTVFVRRLNFAGGCVSAQSVVEGPFGVAFESQDGFHVIDRSLSDIPIGRAIKSLPGALVVTSGTLVPEQNEVRWTLDATGYDWDETATAAVWNYRLNAWSYWTSFETIHACIRDGVYTRLMMGGLVRSETPSLWTDGADAGIVIKTPWIKVAGLQGFLRLWRSTFLGRYWTGHLTIAVEYDYRNTDEEIETLESRQWTESVLQSNMKHSNYTVAGVTTQAYRLQLALRQQRQKIESVRFTITEDPEGTQQVPATAGRGFELVGIQLDCGVKRGGIKNLAAAAKK